jgi:hypothetical protein
MDLSLGSEVKPEVKAGVGTRLGLGGGGGTVWPGHPDMSPETLMNPESCDAGFGIMKVLVGSKHALEDLES